MTSTTATYAQIQIDYRNDRLLSEQAMALLTSKGFYKREWEHSPQETMARAINCFSFGDRALAQRLYDHAARQHWAMSSPVQSNGVDVEWPEFAETEFQEASDWLAANVTPDGMPISCFLNTVADNKRSLVATRTESSWLSMLGGGVGTYAGNRGPDEKSTGVMAHLGGYNWDTISYRQTSQRRGSMAFYMDVQHPEREAFLKMRDPENTDATKTRYNLNHAFNIPDSFMYAVIKDEMVDEIDPKHGVTGHKFSARLFWEEIMQIRKTTGEPYLLFIDTVNRNLPPHISNPNYRCYASNLCSEVTLMANKTRTAVCCLSSVNLEFWEEWKDSTLIEDLTRFLDNVLEYFIRLAPPELARAINSAKQERALGLGALGWHSFLQSKNIAFESGGFNSAISWIHKIHGTIQKRSRAESLRLGALRGEAPDCAGTGMRNSHNIAIAPNANSSSIAGSSPSREPWQGNAFAAQGRAGAYLIKNKYLEKRMKELGIDTSENWGKIIANDGSIRGIEGFTEHDLAVFATFTEIDPLWIVEQAIATAPYVCQSVSLNIAIPAEYSLQAMSDIHFKMWGSGVVKSAYYCRGKPPANISIGTGAAQPLNSVVKQALVFDSNECLSCHG